ncbi:MAG: response regulator [Bacteroidota bacterium]
MSLINQTTNFGLKDVSANRHKFLFVDDSPTDNKYLSLLIRIKKLPIEPHFEYSPHKAISYLLKCDETDFPKVIMVDINMPLMNGFQFVEKYLEHFQNTKENTVLYITSSSTQLSDKERAEKHPHIKGFIEKPFNLAQFQAKILPELK